MKVFNPKSWDWLLVGSALLLSLIGILLIYSAKFNAVLLADRELYVKQIMWLGLALLVFLVTKEIPPKLHEALAYFYYAGGVLLLLLLLAFGATKMGATRWFALGNFNLQPGEIMKISLIMALARFLVYGKKSPRDLTWVLIAALLTLVPVALVLNQPDLGTSIVFVVILFAMLFWAGLPYYFLLLLITPIFSLVTAFHWISWGLFFVALLIFLYHLRPGLWFSSFLVITNMTCGVLTPLVWHRLHDYQKLRIISFLNPGNDPLGAGYQIIQSQVAIGSGGLLGKGFLRGTQNKLEFLPEQHTDFVFSVLGEEFGLVGVIILLAIFALFLFRAIGIAYKSRNRWASFAAWGIASYFAFQIFINLGMTVGIMPVTGLPLPFVSYGGSALLVSWVMVGILQAIYSKGHEY